MHALDQLVELDTLVLFPEVDNLVRNEYVMRPRSGESELTEVWMMIE